MNAEQPALTENGLELNLKPKDVSISRLSKAQDVQDVGISVMNHRPDLDKAQKQELSSLSFSRNSGRSSYALGRFFGQQIRELAPILAASRE